MKIDYPNNEEDGHPDKSYWYQKWLQVDSLKMALNCVKLQD